MMSAFWVILEPPPPLYDFYFLMSDFRSLNSDIIYGCSLTKPNTLILFKGRENDVNGKGWNFESWLEPIWYDCHNWTILTLSSTRWFSVTRFYYNGAKKSHDLLKIQGLSLAKILLVKKKILYKICSPVWML